jgi:hypothetical protein
MAKKVSYVKAGNGLPFLLTATKLVEGSVVEFDGGNLVAYEQPYTMLRSVVRKYMKKVGAFEFPYVERDGDNATQNGNRDAVSINFGCCHFSGENYKKLRRWALKAKK